LSSRSTSSVTPGLPVQLKIPKDDFGEKVHSLLVANNVA